MTTSPRRKGLSLLAGLLGLVLLVPLLIVLGLLAYRLLALPPEPSGLGWRDARNVPYDLRAGLEVARNREGKTLASFSLVCTSTGEVHLLLLTPLPAEDGFRRVRPGRDGHAVLFIGEGISNKMPIIVDTVALSDRHAAKASGQVETIVTPALSRETITMLADWFGPSPPTKVSVAGIDETGVAMVGTRNGREVELFAEACRPS